MPNPDPPSLKWPVKVWSSIASELNFYRIHLIYFTVTPLIFSAIFYASNGRYHVAFIDALFNCFSSMCVCGLATVNLSSLTKWQQVILFIQMQIGHPIFVSWFMVLVRRHYFARRFEHMVVAKGMQNDDDDARGTPPVGGEEHFQRQERRPWSHWMTTLFHPGHFVTEESQDGSDSDRYPKRSIIKKLRPDMIRRMDDAPKLVDPSGWITAGDAPVSRNLSGVPQATFTIAEGDERTSSRNGRHELQEAEPIGATREFVYETTSRGSDGRRRRLSDPGIPSRPVTPTNPIHRYETMMDTSAIRNQRGFPRQQTIEFAPDLQRPPGKPDQLIIPEHNPEVDSGVERNPQSPGFGSIQRSSLGPPYAISTTQTQRAYRTTKSAKHRGFGGFPMPHRLISSIINYMFPKFQRRLTRTVTIPAATSLVSTRAGHHAPPHAKAVRYISFDAIVGRNSAFHLLTHEQLEELGGVEYRALNALLWLVAGYFIGLQLISFAIIAPYISTPRWSDTFRVPNLVRPLSSVWFSLFQVSSAFTNTGSSLVDQSMVPYQKAYAMIVFLMLLILGGNCAYPIFLRLLIWFMTKLIPRKSHLNETLHFLLDHPRRCYTYLFPSHQTWFLLTIVFLLTAIDWFFFMILDIGNTIIEEIPLNTRFAAGLFQAVAVRAAGFSIVSMNNLAPAVKVLYLVMMYISIYPITLSIRSTNVYEEKSLGVFADDDDDLEEKFQPFGPSRINVWSRYLAMHIRRQLAFDMWWLAIATFLICVIERHQINNPGNNVWFNVFNIMFEVVSAYGTVGLSLGISDRNYSLSGAFRPLSKLVICAVILRGRHRSLPVAIDRAILLPSDLEHNDGRDEIQADARSHLTQTSQGAGMSHNPQPNYGADDALDTQLQRRFPRRSGTMSSGSQREPPTTEIRLRPVQNYP